MKADREVFNSLMTSSTQLSKSSSKVILIVLISVPLCYPHYLIIAVIYFYM